MSPPRHELPLNLDMSVRSKNDLISLEIVTFFKPLVAEGQILAKKPKKAIDLFIAFCLEKK